MFSLLCAGLAVGLVAPPLAVGLVAPRPAAPAPRGDVAIVVVTSPARVHPSTELIWSVLGSCSLLEGLERAPIAVVCDGYRPAAPRTPKGAARLAADPCAFSKRGRVTAARAAAYERYKARLRAEIAAEPALAARCAVLELREHAGFAHAAAAGLRWALARGKPLALVAQHDRAFVRRVAAADLALALDFLRRGRPGGEPRGGEPGGARYVGFGSSSSRGHVDRLRSHYLLEPLVAARGRELRPGLRLQPAIFWWDSNHLVDAARALEIFAPFRHAPAALRARVGGPGALRRFKLRRGDFIEDRFGVEQRAFLAALRDEPDELVRWFDWFGTYLLEETVDDAAEARARGEHPWARAGRPLADSRGRVAFVAHIDGRAMTPRAWSRALPSIRAKQG